MKHEKTIIDISFGMESLELNLSSKLNSNGNDAKNKKECSPKTIKGIRTNIHVDEQTLKLEQKYQEVYGLKINRSNWYRVSLAEVLKNKI